MIYAQVHNKSVSDDYYAAMSQIEKQLDLVDIRHENPERPISKSERNHLLLLIDQLAENPQDQNFVLSITEEMHYLLDSSQTDLSDSLATNKDCGLESKSMPVFVIAEVR